jgi:hypothetical protein
MKKTVEEEKWGEYASLSLHPSIPPSTPSRLTQRQRPPRPDVTHCPTGLARDRDAGRAAPAARNAGGWRRGWRGRQGFGPGRLLLRPPPPLLLLFGLARLFRARAPAATLRPMRVAVLGGGGGRGGGRGARQRLLPSNASCVAGGLGWCWRPRPWRSPAGLGSRRVNFAAARLGWWRG